MPLFTNTWLVIVGFAEVIIIKVYTVPIDVLQDLQARVFRMLLGKILLHFIRLEADVVEWPVPAAGCVTHR
jgi:hypothetical protein